MWFNYCFDLIIDLIESVIDWIIDLIESLFYWFDWIIVWLNHWFEQIMDLIESDHWLFWPKVTVQVNLCQKHLFFNQLTHNMTTDCSLIPNFSAKKIQVQDMLCTKIVLNAKTKTKNQFLYTTCSELVFC